MFGLKKKRDPVEIVDITLLQKKGLYPVVLPNSQGNTATYPSVSSQTSATNNTDTSSQSPSGLGDGMDFLSSFANAAAQNDNSVLANTSDNSTSINSLNNNGHDIELSSLKSSVDRISDRILDIVDRIDKLERKIEGQ